MTRALWLRLALRGARWLDRTGLRRLPLIRWGVDSVRDRLFRRGDSPGAYVETEIGGFRWRLPQNLAAGYLRPFESMTRRFLQDSVHSGATVVDVGANIGFHTVQFARAVGPAGCVHAVEPADDNLSYLRWNVEANGLSNVHIHPAAAGSIRRRRTFYLQPKGTHHGFFPRETCRVAPIEVEEWPLDSLASLSPPVDFVKIDTEGAELDVLRGMERTIRESPALRMLVEWNLAVLLDQRLPLEELPELLAAWGFEVLVIDEEERRERQVTEVLETIHTGRFGRLRALNLAARPTDSAEMPTEKPTERPAEAPR